MGQKVNISFEMDADLKRDLEDIGSALGMNLSTMMTVFCKKVVQERGIPFPVVLESDPFYSPGNMRYLEEKYEEWKNGTLARETHELIDEE